MWFDFNFTMFLHSCVLPIHVNQTPRLTEILCFQILCFARAFLSYSCVFPVPAFIESSNSKEPLQIYFIFHIGVKENSVCYVQLLPCHHPPHPRCTTNRSIHYNRDPPCRLSFTASDHLPHCRQPRQLYYHDRLSRWTWGLHSSGREVAVFRVCYVIHRLLLPATLSFNLEFWIAHGSHIKPATNSINFWRRCRGA